MDRDEDARFRGALDADELKIELDALAAFAAVDEPGADALLGDADNALSPRAAT